MASAFARQNAKLLLRLGNRAIHDSLRDASSWIAATGLFVFGSAGLLFQNQSGHQTQNSESHRHSKLHSFTEDALFDKPAACDTLQAPFLYRANWDVDALSKAQGNVLALWKSLPLEIRLSVMDMPRVMLIDNHISIQFSLSEKTDVMHFILTVFDALSRQSHLNIAVKNAGLRLTKDEGKASATLRIECVGPATDMTVQITTPLLSEGCPEVELCNKNGLSDGDFKLLEIIFGSLEKSISDKNNPFQNLESWLQSKPEDDLFLELENRMRDLMNALPFHPSLEQLEGWSIIPETQQADVQNRQSGGELRMDTETPEVVVKKLEGMGAVVYSPNPTEKLDWSSLSGYTEQKRRIEDGLLFPLLHPDVSDSIAKRTRKHYVPNRPRGVLFEGDPGTGKTSSARIIASQASVHMVYLPLESILSKWYGESEKLLSDAFKAADQLGGAIIFFDEIETLGTKRTDDMHEVSRRLLSVLLREMDGFDATKRIIVIGATNRKADMDPALISRFDSIIRFDLPDKHCRSLIFNQYAQQLSPNEIDALATKGENMSGRDIRDICESTERLWASKIVRGEIDKGQLPGFQAYLDELHQRQN